MDSPMDILLMNRSYYPAVGGNETVLYELSKVLAGMGHMVKILTSELEMEQTPSQRKEAASVIRYGQLRFRKIQLPLIRIHYRDQMVKWMQGHADDLYADVAFTTDCVLGMAYAIAFPDRKIVYNPPMLIKYYSRGIRNIQNPTDFILQLLNLFQFKVEWTQQKRILKEADKVVVFSENLRNQIKSSVKIEDGKVIKCFPGITKHKKEKENKKEKSVENGDKNVVSFVFCGRLVKEKNLDMLFRAISLLDKAGVFHDGGNRVKFYIIGDGGLRSYYEHVARKLRIDRIVRFLGTAYRPQAIYETCDFFMIPSTYESFGLVNIDAMQYGLPVIGFSTIKGKTMTALDELVIDGKTGYISREYSPKGLADQILRAYRVKANNIADYKAMKKACSEFAYNYFKWENVAQEIIST